MFRKEWFWVRGHLLSSFERPNRLVYTGINTTGVAETFGVVPAGSASEHLAKLPQQNLKGSHLTVPSSVTSLRGYNSPGAQLSSYTFPHLLQKFILKQHHPPSLLPHHLQTHHTPAVQPTFFIWQGQNAVTGQGIICSSLSVLFNTAGCLLTTGKLLLILLRRWNWRTLLAAAGTTVLSRDYFLNNTSHISKYLYYITTAHTMIDVTTINNMQRGWFWF